MAPAQPGNPDVVEALSDDVVHRQQGWKPGEKELMTRSVEALEKIAKNTSKIADASVDNTLPETPTTPPPEGQPKGGKPK